MISAAQTSSASDYDNVGIETLPTSLRGNSECFADLDLAFAVSGVLEKVSVAEGATVKAGDLLISLGSESDVIEAERRRQIWLDRSELEAAQIKAIVTMQQYEAAKELQASGGAISSEEVQNRKLAADIDAVEVKRLTSAELIQELDYKSAQDTLSKRTLIAPSAGIVSEIIKKAGESAQAYEPIIKLCDIQKIIFVANLPDSVTASLDVGAIVTLKFTNSPGTVDGLVKFISPVVDAATGLRKVKVDLPNGLSWMRPGLTADLLLTP